MHLANVLPSYPVPTIKLLTGKDKRVFRALKKNSTSMNFLRPRNSLNETLVALIHCCYHGKMEFFSFNAHNFSGCAFFGLFDFPFFFCSCNNRKHPAVNLAMILTLAVCATGVSIIILYPMIIRSWCYCIAIKRVPVASTSTSCVHFIFVQVQSKKESKNFVVFSGDNWNLNIFMFEPFFSLYRLSFDEHIFLAHITNNTFRFMLNSLSCYLHIGNSWRCFVSISLFTAGIVVAAVHFSSFYGALRLRKKQ